MVTLDKHLVVIGGFGGVKGYATYSDDYQSPLYLMTCQNKVCGWYTMSQELNVGREDFVAMLIPDELTDCGKNFQICIFFKFSSMCLPSGQEIFGMVIYFNIFQSPLNARRTRIALITLHVEEMESVLKLVSKADFIISIHPFATYNISECTTDSDCPDHLACGDDKGCVDLPCPDCAVNAHCEASNHKGICTCSSGYEGCKIGKKRWLYHLYSSFCHIQFFRMHNRL